jgi:hypothetical protein
VFLVGAPSGYLVVFCDKICTVDPFGLSCYALIRCYTQIFFKQKHALFLTIAVYECWNIDAHGRLLASNESLCNMTSSEYRTDFSHQWPYRELFARLELHHLVLL